MIGLIVFTATLLVWQHFGMERVMEFSAASGRPVELVDDRLQQGGSVARLTRRPDALTMDCDLRLTFQWPYCRFLFTLSKNEVGVDLSEFDSISFDMSYEGRGDHTARLVLRNFELGMSTLNDYMSQKVNETGNPRTGRPGLHGLRVTASFGVTALQPGEVSGDAIKHADSALCQAKSHGRNCVRAA
ncbi:diguanylate cyclase domain-containing protein [Massilia frigida]|uniref:diguanylate cyclase domain-containing protein n=1 Tax=Massilia frigida TaxID=2609281 RepID=UPI0016520456|nr:diguanylate cyclase [Massilia frigida]